MNTAGCVLARGIVNRRTTDTAWWRRRKARRPVRQPKEPVYASGDELLAQRLRELRVPEPPPAVRERNRARYQEWLSSQANRNRWRD